MPDGIYNPVRDVLRFGSYGLQNKTQTPGLQTPSRLVEAGMSNCIIQMLIVMTIRLMSRFDCGGEFVGNTILNHLGGIV